MLLLLASFPAFAQQGEKDPYVGLSKSQILIWFGQPETKESNSRGEVLTFERVRKFEWNRRVMPTIERLEKFPGTGTVKRVESYQFFFDKKDAVYSWKIDTLLNREAVASRP